MAAEGRMGSEEIRNQNCEKPENSSCKEPVYCYNSEVELTELRRISNAG
jgi:hypothetical protein